MAVTGGLQRADIFEPGERDRGIVAERPAGDRGAHRRGQRRAFGQAVERRMVEDFGDPRRGLPPGLVAQPHGRARAVVEIEGIERRHRPTGPAE